MNKEASTEKLLLTVREAADLIGISRDRVYTLIRTGEIESLKIGGLRRIARTSANEYVEHKLAEARGAGA